MGEVGATASGNAGEAAVRELWGAWEAQAGRQQGAPPAGAAGGPDARADARGRSGATVGGKAFAAMGPLGSAGGGGRHGSSRGHGGKSGGAGGSGVGHQGASWWTQVSVLTGRAIKVRRFEQVRARAREAAGPRPPLGGKEQAPGAARHGLAFAAPGASLQLRLPGRRRHARQRARACGLALHRPRAHSQEAAPPKF
jgi:hypothetical protein